MLDNALSARRELPFGNGLEPITIEVTIEEREDGTYQIQVADHGTGMSLDDITNRIFNPGGQGSHKGDLNEHGFGLKNALALLTGGNSTNFTLLTRSQDAQLDGDHFYGVSGPLSTEMEVRDDATRAEWSEGLHHLANAETGTKISVIVQARYFRTIYRVGGAGFDLLVRGLGEQTGVMHRYYVTAGNHIRVAYRRTGQEWIYHAVQPIPVPIEGEARTKTKTIHVGGVAHNFTHTHGVSDYNVKDPEAEQERGWPYPLRIYYQGSNSRRGVDIVVRDRVIKSGVFEEIWPEIGKTVDFNKFVGEVKVGADFRTTNNKTGLDPHGENWEELLKELAAILEAFKAVSLRMRELTGLDTGGADLVGKAVGGTSPMLQIADQSTQSGCDTQAGYQHLFRGAIMGIRNPNAHELFQLLEDNEAIEGLTLASLLRDRLDAATVTAS